MSPIANAAVAAILALSLGTAASAAAQETRPAARAVPARRGPLTMDVAGVRLGMPLAAAQAALAGTYRCTMYRAASYRQLVDREVGRRRGVAEGFGPDGAAVRELTCTGPADEYLRLFMAETPAGTVVDRIDLTIRTERVDATELIRQVERKYGMPTDGKAANGSWCSVRCGYDLTMEPDPRIDVRSDAWSFKVIGTRGRAARQADEAAVKAAAVREAPAAKRGAF